MGIYSITENLIGTRNTRLLSQLYKIVVAVNNREKEWQELSDSELQAKTYEFKSRISRANYDKNQLIIEAFATVREASRRVLNMRHFDVQLLGGLGLHQGKIAEMRTGEGKTLVATLPAYLNALDEKGVHVVTVNDYLATRDAKWMKPLYEFLGLGVGVIKAGLTPFEKKRAYEADVTYCTNNQLAWDYLSDHMVLDASEKVQRGLHYALVDEVDSILIDESRTPLIISGGSEESSRYYELFNQIVPSLKAGETNDFTVDEKRREVYLTEQGHARVEEQLVKFNILRPSENLYSPEYMSLVYYISAALRAHHLYKRDVDYIVRADQVDIVDEHTGRPRPGNRWSDGLHQAIEAKEKVSIKSESQTLASITYQNFFRLYHKLSGMTGTAATEADEFQQIYGLEVVTIPTNRPIRGQDFPDQIYLTRQAKWEAIVKKIQDCLARKQPVLVGTTSIEDSEILSRLLQNEGIKHQVLNAKRHEKEASIIAEAGRPGAVTIATNMAGRGTDIILGGNLKDEIAALNTQDPAVIETVREQWRERYDAVIACGEYPDTGGLFIILSGRHDSRRIDNQFIGRGKRQGDPGASQCYISLEDDLIRIFGGERLKSMMTWFGMKSDEALSHPKLDKRIQNIQQEVEARHFDMRKELLEYDNVANEQRKAVYEFRDNILNAGNVGEFLEHFWEDVLDSLVEEYIPRKLRVNSYDVGYGPVSVPKSLQGLAAEGGLKPLFDKLKTDFNISPLSEQGLYMINSIQELPRAISQAVKMHENRRWLGIDAEERKRFEKTILLQTLDRLWKDHLSILDQVRRGIYLRGYAQKNPKQEYKREAFALFESFLNHLKYQSVSELSRCEFKSQVPVNMTDDSFNLSGDYGMIGRNEPCPCQSGKKFKHCHGRLT